jgi:hypothetical protein
MELVKILCEIHYILWTYLEAAVWGVPTHTVDQEMVTLHAYPIDDMYMGSGPRS